MYKKVGFQLIEDITSGKKLGPFYCNQYHTNLVVLHGALESAPHNFISFAKEFKSKITVMIK